MEAIILKSKISLTKQLPKSTSENNPSCPQLLHSFESGQRRKGFPHYPQEAQTFCWTIIFKYKKIYVLRKKKQLAQRERIEGKNCSVWLLARWELWGNCSPHSTSG